MTISKTVAIIPARGGSKGLKRKNIRPFDGVPMIVYTIRAALEASCIDRVCVSTEDAEIAQISKDAGACVIPRPVELAIDNATTMDVVLHALDYVGNEYNTYVMLQPTSPLRDAVDIEEAFAIYRDTPDCSSVIAVCESPCHPWKTFIEDDGCITPLHNRNTLNVARQGLPKTYVQTGGIYIGYVPLFKKEKDLYMEPMIPYFTTREKGIDIDSEMEFNLAEMIYKAL